MADNTVLNSGSGGDTLATDDIGGIKFPRSKIVIGADGVNGGDVSAANPLPISDASGSLTVDAPVGTPVFVRLSDGTSAITTLPVSLASVPSHAVTNAGTFAVQAAQTGTWTVTGTGGTFPITDSGGSITIDNATLSVAGGGLEASALRVTLASDSTGVLSVDDNGGSLTVDGTVAATQSGTWTVQPGNTANTTAWLVTGTGGTFPSTQSGTWNIGTVTTVTGVTTVTTLTTCGTVTTLTGSSIAHDAADSQNPHKIGARATTALSGVTLVADADRTHLYAGVDGVLITRPHCNLEDLVNGTADITDGSSTSVIAAQGASVKTYVTDVIISNSSASAVTVTIRDGAAGTVKATFMVPAGAPVHKVLTSPIGFSANTAVCADPSAAASTVSVTLSGFKSKV